MDIHLSEAAELLWAARALRRVLDDVVPSDAGVLGPRIDELLAEAARCGWAQAELAPVVDGLTVILSERAETRAWMREFRRGFAATRSGTGYLPLPGHGSPIPPAGTYACAECGFVWARRVAGQEVPECPKDGSALRRSDESRL